MAWEYLAEEQSVGPAEIHYRTLVYAWRIRTLVEKVIPAIPKDRLDFGQWKYCSFMCLAGWATCYPEFMAEGLHLEEDEASSTVTPEYNGYIGMMAIETFFGTYWVPRTILPDIRNIFGVTLRGTLEARIELLRACASYLENRAADAKLKMEA